MLSAINTTNGDTLAWMEANQDKINKVKAILEELQSYTVLDLAMLSAAIREFGHILVD